MDLKINDIIFFGDVFGSLATNHYTLWLPPWTSFLNNYKGYIPGTAIITDIIGSHKGNEDRDVYQLLFNNSNGIRYVYKFDLEKALNGAPLAKKAYTCK